MCVFEIFIIKKEADICGRDNSFGSPPGQFATAMVLLKFALEGSTEAKAAPNLVTSFCASRILSGLLAH